MSYRPEPTLASPALSAIRNRWQSAGRFEGFGGFHFTAIILIYAILQSLLALEFASVAALGLRLVLTIGHASLGAALPAFANAGSRDVAFARARRHSLTVRILRYGIISASVAIVFGLLLTTLYDPFGRRAPGLSVGKIEFDGARIAMDRPVLSGYGRDGKPYILHALRAVQDRANPGKVELEGIDADMVSSDNSKLHMVAQNGLYESQIEHMSVSGEVRLNSDAYDIKLKTATLDFKSGIYNSDDPVVITIRGGTDVSADSIIAADNGKTLTLVGRVRSRMAPEAQGSQQKDEK